METQLNSMPEDIAAIAVILLCALGLFRVFQKLRLFALRFACCSWLEDERISRFFKVITLIPAGLITVYYVDKDLLELFTGLLYCGLMYQVAVVEAPPEEPWEDDDDY
ncbi:MAG: hypothetical protein IJD04_06055 [Desulfovibrionaceae bacterium]|nr:hypothetical protein [Desulfovibrionaceae bacterium]